MLEIEKMIRLRAEYVLQKLDIGDGKFWLFNIENGDAYRLNRTSYVILSLVDGRTIEEIKNRLLENYPDKPQELISRDLQKFLERIQRENIIEEGRLGNGNGGSVKRKGI